MKKNLLMICLILGMSRLFLSADPVDAYESAREFQNRGDWYSAIENYQDALRQNPSYSAVFQGLSECFYALGEYEQALAQVIKAETFKKSDPGLQNLRGFILIGLGKLDEASTIFSRVLQTWPNDINARFGIAEIDVSAGRVTAASGKYLEALRRFPENRKALLSLALVSRENGNNAAARDYISKALQYHGDSPQVFFFAAYIATQDGQFAEAEGRIKNALALQEHYDDAQELLGTILYKTGRYQEVIDICDKRIAMDRNRSSAWYLRTLALEKMRRYEEAIRSAQTGLQISSDDELLRGMLEKIVIGQLAFEDPRRAGWAAWHSDKAKLFEQKNMSDQALYEYRRALKVNPYDTNSRQSYAKLLLTRGYPGRFVEQLRFIQSLGKSNNSINDAVESYGKLLSNSIPVKWKIDPLYLDKAHMSLGLYFQNDPANVMHPDSERLTAAALAEVFSYDVRFTVAAQESPVLSYSEAFRTSRTQGEDYFGLVKFRENDRDMQITVDLYVSGTGSKAGTFTIFRTGTDRYANALRRLEQAIVAAMPVRGAVLSRFQSDAIIDMGKADGITVDQRFEVIVKNAVKVENEGIGIKYDPSKVLGYFTVTAVDEDVSQGKLERSGFYDRINAGDVVVLKPIDETKKEPKEEVSNQSSPPALLSLLRKIR